MTEDAQSRAPRWLVRLIWVAVFFALLRNLFPPNSFTATVLIFDYEHGLVRRGFWGEVLNLYWGETVSKAEVFAASAVLTLAGVAAILVLFVRQCLNSETGARFMLLFVTSFAFAAVVSATGYIDLAHVGLVALALFVSPGHALGVGVRIAVVALGVLMHEVMLAYFAVFFLFEIYISRNGRNALPLAALPLAAGLAVFGVLTVWGQLSPEDVQAYIAHIEAKSEFTAEPEATVVMERTLGDNLAMMAEKRGMIDYRSWVLFDGLPLLAMSGWLLFVAWRLLPASASMSRLLLVGAFAAPLSLNVIAFDVVRFGAISVVVGFLAILVLLRQRPMAHARLTEMMGWPVMVVVLVVNLNVTVNQMNTGDGQDHAVPWALIKQLDWIK